MNVAAIDQSNTISPPDNAAADQRLKKAAIQFEAVLLMQLTSALNGSGDDENALFGSDAGSGLAKQLFSEQMASVMAETGSLGIADMMMRQLSDQKPLAGTGGIKGLADVVSTVKSLHGAMDAPIKVEPNARQSKNRTVSAVAEGQAFTGDPNEFSIVSTAQDDLLKNGIDDSLKNLILDGRVVNPTRARIVPNAPIIEVGSNSADLREVQFQKPVSGRISSDFGSRFHPIDKRTRFHGGMDIAVPTGTTVSAAAEGTVVFAGRKGGYGNLVIVEHPDGRETRYAHLSSISVAAGDPVTQGQPIALSGSTGRSTGPHLHFEIREEGVAVDPRRFLSNVLSGVAER